MRLDNGNRSKSERRTRRTSTGKRKARMNKAESVKNPTSHLHVEQILREFQEAQERPSRHRKGTFKIDAPFAQALEKIAKATPSRLTHTDTKTSNERNG